MKTYALYILDLDGTLYRGEQAIPHAVEVVAELRRRGAGIRFLTNNSGETRETFVEKLRRLGFQVLPGEVVSSAIGAARHLNREGLKSAFVIGEAGLHETLREQGIAILKASDEEADSVVVGICRSFTYDLMREAMQRIRSGSKFVATNTDATYPVENGGLIPGAGSIVAAIQACSDVEPFVIGKPNPYLINLILESASVPAAEALVVGDRCETDIEAGIRAGCPTHLVLTGIAKEPPTGQSFSEDLRGLL